MKNAKNSYYMKYANRKAILNIIRKEQISRADLARKTGLTRAGISLIIDELVKDGIVIETGFISTINGRRPVLLGLNPDKYYTIGLNLSRKACKLGIIDFLGRILIEKNLDLNKFTNAFEAVTFIASEIDILTGESIINKSKIIGLGVTSPGPLETTNGIILDPPNFDMWHNIEIVKELKNKLDLKIKLENISSARALAEKNYGIGAEYDNFLLLVVDEGVGSGIIMNNRLFHGAGGYGSEVGHTTIDLNGRICNCGNKGCVETYASIPNIIYNSKKKDDIKSWYQIIEKAELGEPDYIKIVEKEAKYLSAAIVNLLNILDLDAVILSGDISYKPDRLMVIINETVKQTSITRGIHDIKILSSSIKSNAEVLVSAGIMLEEIFSLDNFQGIKNEY